MRITQPYNLKRIVIAWIAAIILELGRRGVEPANGPGDIVFLPLLSVLFSFPAMVAVLFVGLTIFIPPLNRAWYRHHAISWSLILMGIAAYIFGVYSAHHAHFTLRAPAEVANGYLVQWALPGGLCTVFSLCFMPHGRRSLPMELPPSPVQPSGLKENNLDRYLRKREGK